MALIMLAAGGDWTSLVASAGQYFQWEGHRVELFTQGEELKARLAEERPDLVVSGMVLPHTDGPELAALLRERYPEQPPGLILLTTPMSKVGSSLRVLPGDLLAQVDAIVLKHPYQWEVVEQLILEMGVALARRGVVPVREAAHSGASLGLPAASVLDGEA